MIISLLTGLITGIIFRILNLPIPAPQRIEGIVGIIGIFLGYTLWKTIK